MRIICPNCSAQYDVDASLFPEAGREVQCAQCETKWVQYPAPPEPMPLTQPVAAPSARLPQSERDAIRAAVQDEMDISGQEAQQQKAEEEDLMASLRQQLAEDDTDYDNVPDDDRVSGRRSVSRAADIAGVAVEPEEPQGGGIFAAAKPAQEKEKAKPNALAAALQEYERERGPRRGGRAGFLFAVLLAGLAAGAYFGRNHIATYYPPAKPYLEDYVRVVDQSRDKVVEVWSNTTAFLTEKIDAAMAPDETASE